MSTLHRNTAATGAGEGDGNGGKDWEEGIGGEVVSAWHTDSEQWMDAQRHEGGGNWGNGEVCRACERLIEVEGYGSSAAEAG